MKNGKLVGTYRTADVTEDEVLGMIIAGKRPEGREQARRTRRRRWPRPGGFSTWRPRMKTIGDQQLLERINRSVLLLLSRAQPGLSRARLASESGLTKSTVSLLGARAARRRLAQRIGRRGGRRARRPSTPLQINVGVRALMGIEIAVDTARLACVSLQGEVLYSDEQALADSAPAGTCAQVARMAAAAHRRLAERGLRLSSIGVCVPGAVDDCTGVVRFAPNLGWRNVSLLPDARGRAAAAGLHGRHGAAAERCRCGRARRVRVRRRRGRRPADLRELRRRRGRGRGAQRPPVHRRAGHGRRDRPHHPRARRPAVLGGRRGCAEAFFGSRALAREAVDMRAPRPSSACCCRTSGSTFNPRAIVLGGKSCAEYRGFAQAAFESVKRHADGAGDARARAAHRALARRSRPRWARPRCACTST